MKITRKTKVLFVIIPVLVLMGIFLLQKLESKKYLDHAKSLILSLSPDFGEREAEQNKCSTRNEDSKLESVEHIKETPLHVSLSSRKQNEESVFEDRFSELELPSPFEEHEMDTLFAKAQADRVWIAEDKLANTWPAYLDIREQLHKELLAELDLENLTNEQLIHIGLIFRRKFWQEGGCFSEASFRNGYKARILLELAHNRSPENRAITNELIETIQSTETLWRYQANSKERIKNSQAIKDLSKLRTAQYEQIKKEVEQGRIPVWEDFICVSDLAHLLVESENYEFAQEVVEWAIRKAIYGGWMAYMQPLEEMLSEVNQGNYYYFNIHIADKSDYPEEFKYGRRLPSFQGPDPEKRGIIPLHLKVPNPIWL